MLLAALRVIWTSALDATLDIYMMGPIALNVLYPVHLAHQANATAMQGYILILTNVSLAILLVNPVSMLKGVRLVLL